jgi:predicted ATPase/class 3 adenylate cyclase
MLPATVMPARRPDLPTGTVTFMFTDIEGSTRLLATLGDAYRSLLETHNRILREAIAQHDGTEVGTEGDAFFAAFGSAIDAVVAAVEAQRALVVGVGSGPTALKVRIGLHTGEGRLGGDDYVGLDVHRASRIAAAGHGGQVLISDATRSLVAHALPEGVALRDLGFHRLKDLPHPERLWQLDVSGLERDFPAVRSLDPRPSNLPVLAAPLVGREAEIEMLVELLNRRRLVTLTGPGGIGKTRLAVAIARRLQGDHADGAVFVALEDARDRSAAAAAIASALGVRETLDRDLEQGVKEYVRERELLLLLDNFEQLVEASPLVGELLTGAPRLCVLVTSRASLHLSEEQTFEVPPLGLPDPGHLPVLAELTRYEAVALFIERAQAALPRFAVTDDNAPAVAAICRRLDGLPLAIELAASWVRLLSPEAILERLDRSLPLLVSGPRDLPARQRTLRGAIDGSYALLHMQEQRLFARLAVFAGGWTLEAAESVCDPEGGLDGGVLEGLASLVDKSLVRALPEGRDEPRFEMAQVIREFAAEKLDAEPDADEIRRRHAAYVLALTERAEPELRGSSLRGWQGRLRVEAENIRAALRWGLDDGEIETGLRTAGALFDYWHYWGELREGRRWLEALLWAPGAEALGGALAKPLTGLAGLVYWQGNGDRAWALYEEALTIRRAQGEAPAIAEALLNSAWAAIARWDLASAVERAGEALEHYREAGEDAEAELVRGWLAVEPVIMGMGGDVLTAREAIRRGVVLTRQLGRIHDATDQLTGIAMIERMAGDHRRAVDAGREALRAWYDLGNLGRVPICLKILAAAELGLGHAGRAGTLGAAAERYNEQFGGELAAAFGSLGQPAEEARALLPAEDHARAIAAGRSMSLEGLIAYALETPREATPPTI